MRSLAAFGLPFAYVAAALTIHLLLSLRFGQSVIVGLPTHPRDWLIACGITANSARVTQSGRGAPGRSQVYET